MRVYVIFKKMKSEKIENFKCEAGASDSEPTIDSYWENASSLPNFLGGFLNLILPDLDN